MKFSMTLLAALAASTSISASPVRRVYTLADAFLSEDMQEPDTISSLTEAEEPTIEFPVEERPCTHGDDCHSSSSSSGGSIFSPIDALISKIGYAADHPSQAEEIFAQSQVEVNVINHDQVEDVGSVFEEWKSHLEEMFREAASQDDVVVMVEEEVETPEVEVEEDELNDVKWWRVAEGGKWQVKSGNGKWRDARNGEKPPMGKQIPKSTRLQAEEAEEEGALERHQHHHGHHHNKNNQHAQTHHLHHHHHNVASTLIERLQRVIRNLQPIEAIAFALVLGAGFGSIAHAIFMFALIALRRVRGTDTGSRRIRLEENLPAYTPLKGEKA